MVKRSFRITILFLLSALLQLGNGVGVPLHHHQTPRDKTILPSGLQRPPQSPYVYNDTAESIERISKLMAANERATVQAILDSVKDPKYATFENVVQPYYDKDNANAALSFPLGAYSLSSVPGIYDAVSKLDDDVDVVITETFSNKALTDLVVHVYQANHDATTLSTLNDEQLTILEDFYSSFGLLTLAPAQRDRYNNLTQRNYDLQDEFTKNAEQPKYVYFTAEELDGVPADSLQTLEKANATGENAGKLQYDVQVFDKFIAVNTYAVNETTRYTNFLARDRIAPENESILKEILKTQLEMAQLFNYSSWADFTLSNTIASNTTTVNAFLQDLHTHLTDASNRNVASIAQAKSKDTVVSPVGDKDVAYRWDYNYYPEKERQTLFDINQDKIAEYFPANVTVPAILEFYGEIFSVRYDRITGLDADALSPTGNGGDLLWHPDVMMYAVWDDFKDSTCNTTNVIDPGFRGYLYLDLFYREGVKDGHDSNEQNIFPGYTKPDGSRVHPASRVMMNLHKSDQEDIKPSLIPYRELPGLMHELGHCMHDVLSVTNYARTIGTSVPIDFVEFPSQFMENFSRVPQALRQISRHWSSFSPQAAEAWRKEQSNSSNSADVPLPPATMPDDMIANVINSTRVNLAAGEMRQIIYGTWDQELFQLASADEITALDISARYNTLYRNFSSLGDPSDLGQDKHWGFYPLSDTFLANQYAGTYYAYQWCLSYAEDVFFTAFAADPFNSDVGMRYRTQVLQPGSSTDPVIGLKEFLGRDPNNEAFLAYLDMSV